MATPNSPQSQLKPYTPNKKGTRASILAIKDDRVYEDVYIPEWGMTVTVQSMTGAERDAFEDESVRMRGNRREVRANFRARFVVRVLVDDDKHLMFTDEDATVLGQRNASALQKIFNVGNKLSAMTDEDVDEILKNSSSGQSADSGSTLP